MKTSPLTLSALILTTATTLLTAPTAEASTCHISTSETKLNAGHELSNGVPNYAQGSFDPGSGDCSPTAIAMVLGYWDANGWSCMFKDTDPYTAGAAPHASILGSVEWLKARLDFVSGAGTSHGFFNTWAPAIESYVQKQDAGAAAWTVDDDFWLSQGDITSEIDAERPVVFSILGVSGKQVTWNSPTGSTTGHTRMSHSMPVLGYRRVAEGMNLFGGCVDWLDADEFYVVTRSGWANGGSSQIYYHWGIFDGRTAVKVQPAGTPSCTGGTVSACPYTNDGECDEPEGLAHCAEGTDVDDCSCAWRFDGECDEAQGTNLCPAYSDRGDC